MQEFLNYINGTWTRSANPSNLEKINPFNGSLLGHVACSDAMDVIAALPHAKKAQQEFAKTSLHERATLLRKIADLCETHADKYALLEATHQGLPQKFVKEKSILAAAHFFRQAAIDCERAEQQNTLALPVGLVSIISSWCLSLRLISERLAPALAAGNAVLIKISELSPVTALILAELFTQSQMPVGLVQMFQGQGAQVGNILAAHPSIRAVSFIGNGVHAENVLKAATSNYKKAQISAGAKNSALVLNETDFKSLLPKILESFLIGQGQLCWNTQRLFIPESISADFMQSLHDLLERLVPAEGPESDSLWLPVIDAKAVLSIRQKAQLARQEHAKLISAEEKSSSAGFFAKPTFTLDLTNCSVLQQDEVHGPLFIVTPVKYQHEMIKWSNTGYLGHSAVVWGPKDKVKKPAEALECSYIWTNDWLSGFDPVAGHKQSSFGNMDMNPIGSFFSDVKKVSPP